MINNVRRSVRRREEVRVPRVRLHVREAEPAENPLGPGLRQVAARQTLVQAVAGGSGRRSDRSVVPVQPDAREAHIVFAVAVVVLAIVLAVAVADVATTTTRRADVVRIGFPAVLARFVVGQQ